MVENNGENVEHMIVDVDISLEEGMDPSKTTEYLEKLDVGQPRRSNST